MKVNPWPTYFHSNIVSIDGLRIEKWLIDWYTAIFEVIFWNFEYLTEKKKFLKKDDRFVFLKSVINLAFLPAILEFSLCLINDVGSLHKLFQAERSLVVFLCEILQTLCNILKWFVRSEVLNENTTPRKLMTIDLNNGKNILPATWANIRFRVRKILNKFSTVQAADYQAFCQNAHKFPFQFVEWCPLKYPLTWALSSFSLLQIKVASNSVLIKLVEKSLEILVNAGWMSSIYAYRAQNEHTDSIKNIKNIDVVRKFDIIKDHLDSFYMKICNQSHIHFCEVISCV